MHKTTSPKVLIIGCGVAGPVIALFLHKKGYEPIVLEKVRALGDAGASMMLYPNGFKVLEKIGLADFVTKSSPQLTRFCDRASYGEDLGMSYLPSEFKERYGQPGAGVKRATLNLALKDALDTLKIQVREGWHLEKIIENEESVIAVSQDGQRIEGSFLIGCDGVKAISRNLILQQHGMQEGKPSYTGIMVTAGISPTPPSILTTPGMLNVFGPGAHMICYPISPTHTSWAITQRDLTENKETWRLIPASEIIDRQNELLSSFDMQSWCEPVPELIRGAERIIKYGTYDREQLEPDYWYSPKGHCVLIGDAAHPTSPHLGQGANQALEDCYHLDRLLPAFNKDDGLSSADLKSIFATFARLRQPRTSALVKGARAHGETRVVDDGLAACLERDERLRRSWEDTEALERKYDALYREPYQI